MGFSPFGTWQAFLPNSRFEGRARNLESLIEPEQSSSVFQIQFTKQTMLFCWCHTCKGLFKIHGKEMFQARISFLANWAIKLMHIYKNRINYITYHHIACIYRAGVFYLGTVVPKSLDFSSTVQKKKKKAKHPPFTHYIPHYSHRLGSSKRISKCI